MTPKERIRKILRFQRPDRIGMHDTFLRSTVTSWIANGLPADTRPEDYFKFDLELISLEDAVSDTFSSDNGNERFRVLSFSEPLQRLCDAFGREDVLRKLGRCPKELAASLEHETCRILRAIEKATEKETVFDGAWAWGDMAYTKGPFFSPSWYRDNLLPLHKRIFEFLSSKGLPLFFHSEGNIRDLIPDLLDAGVRVLHPLEREGGMDIGSLIEEYKHDAVFMGHVDIADIAAQTNPLETVKERLGFLKKGCSYIYSASYPIMPNISFRNYSRAIDAVREAGAY